MGVDFSPSQIRSLTLAMLAFPLPGGHLPGGQTGTGTGFVNLPFNYLYKNNTLIYFHGVRIINLDLNFGMVWFYLLSFLINALKLTSANPILVSEQP